MTFIDIFEMLVNSKQLTGKFDTNFASMQLLEIKDSISESQYMKACTSLMALDNIQMQEEMKNLFS